MFTGRPEMGFAVPVEAAVVESIVKGDDLTACIGHVGQTQRDIPVPILILDESVIFPDSFAMILFYDFYVVCSAAIAIAARDPMTES